MPVDEAVARLTSRSAALLGSSDRGRIAPELRADLVLLDPERFVDAATYDDPCRAPEGVVGVWVAGERVCVTARRPARVRAASSGRSLFEPTQLAAPDLAGDSHRQLLDERDGARILYAARRSRTNACSSRASSSPATAPGAATTYAFTISPRSGSGAADHGRQRDRGMADEAPSISPGPMRYPELVITSSSLPTKRR